MSHRKFDFRTAYIDLLINLLTGTVVLFILTTLLISTVTKQNEGIKKNADYVITMEWPENIDCDVDMWVRDPQNNIVAYKRPESGLMYYERDDMGQRRSIFDINGQKTVIDPDNKEYVTLRGTFPGEYIVNAHVYSCKAANEEKGLPIDAAVNVPVTIELMKINPSLVSVKKVILTMTNVWQEQTAFRFVMGDNKNVIRLMTDYVSIMGEEAQK
jgi:YD repeat-containing protein